MSEEQVEAYVALCAKSYDALQCTLGPKDRAKIAWLRSLRSADHKLASKLTDQVGGAQRKYDKAVEALERAALYAAMLGTELETLQAKQKEAADRAMQAFAQLGSPLTASGAAQGSKAQEIGDASLLAEMQALFDKMQD
ncbi:unnamed protein product, partial [Prorocentrum cordatum]